MTKSGESCMCQKEKQVKKCFNITSKLSQAKVLVKQNQHICQSQQTNDQRLTLVRLCKKAGQMIEVRSMVDNGVDSVVA